MPYSSHSQLGVFGLFSAHVFPEHVHCTFISYTKIFSRLAFVQLDRNETAHQILVLIALAISEGSDSLETLLLVHTK